MVIQNLVERHIIVIDLAISIQVKNKEIIHLSHLKRNLFNTFIGTKQLF